MRILRAAVARAAAIWTRRAPGGRPRIRFDRQILALQIGVVALVVGVGFALVGWLLDQQLTDRYEQQALAVARSVAADPDIAEGIAAGDPRQVVRNRAARVRQHTHALFVVVTDNAGIRLSHPHPAEIGRHVSTDPSRALAGHEVVNVQRGTLGLSARGKVPVYDANHDIVGEVSVGFAARDIRANVLRVLGDAGLFAAGSLLLGVAGSALLARRLKTQTLGLEPHELAELVQEREAVLHGVGEGVLAVGRDGVVSVCNDEAARLLGIDCPAGTLAADLDLPIRLRAALSGQTTSDRMMAVAGDRVLVVTRRQVRRDSHDLGTVLTLRDRTDLETLTRELDAVRSLSQALRAQRHEFANRLHTLAGLLQTDHHAEAVEYLHALSGSSPAGAGPVPAAVHDPYLQSFLAGKTAEATESDVRLEVADTSWVPRTVSAPVEVTTVVGNLVDNAVRAARLGTRQPARVEITLLAEGDTLHVSVADSGDGVPAELRASIFADGVTTRLTAGHGLGLALARQAARSQGGDVELVDPGDAGHGAVFVAQLPGVLSTGEDAS
ncbi:MAG: sensor histidine kinase [Actinocatenispora sp.]